MAEEQGAVSALNIRSVNYPYIRLEDAVNLSEKLWESVQKSAVDPGTVGKVWGFSEKSSGLRSAIAALRQFGLVESSGWGESRKLKLSSRALDIVTERPGSPRRAQAIRDAALAPKIYADIFARFPDGLPPSDHAIASYLLLEKDFNKNAVPTFVANLRANLKYADLTNPPERPGSTHQVERDVLSHQVEDNKVIGDLASVTTNATGKQPPLNSEREWLRGQLSRDTSYRLIVAGDIGPKEIGKLIKILTAQQEVLAEDDD